MSAYNAIAGHPTRRAIVELLRAEPTTKRSPAGLAEQLEEPLANIAYHVRIMLGAGILARAGTAQRRGAIQHYYRLNLDAYRAAIAGVDVGGTIADRAAALELGIRTLRDELEARPGGTGVYAIARRAIRDRLTVAAGNLEEALPLLDELVAGDVPEAEAARA
jgi:DNA-binding transcriptional ArsR family regulator